MYDVAVIGAGIVGTSIARELSRYDLSVVVIEKSSDIANGSTKANSGIVHAGYDAKEGTLKAKFNVLGSEMYEGICKELDVPYKRNGSLVLAFNDDDLRHIEILYKRGLTNGVRELEIIDKNKVLSLEPNIQDDVVGALYAKTGAIVSPFELAIALAENANQNGVEFMLSTEVIKVYKEKDVFIIETSKGVVQSRYLVNAAGLFADDINDMLGGERFRIIPRRGEYCLFDKAVGGIVTRTIFQTPTNKGKGILVSPTVHGNLFVGPNAVEMDRKDDVSTTKEGLDEVLRGGSRSVKGLNPRDIITSFTGIRATPDTGDFVINIPTKNAVNAAGIESPGLTASVAIAPYVVSLLEEQGLRLIKKENFIATRQNTKLFINMSEDEKKEVLSKNPMYGRIICRCEHITEGDIVSAIRRPLGARSVDGVKRRVRAGMGRCQGGFCMPRVVEILARELNIPLTEVKKSDEGSFILTGKTK
ncbi:NAD(P)/FAD-dependent oxidoreductase [Thermobrachium celere]|uniref:Glycerol-3-phosphate dehydrogenase n=1 Tax=Thermobrachium celere DSM 8682 TaxID=941824 RepID=R7RT04_9CLOT|nr:NAD(P)/FAD-dependent oxidoreductase [Thermobrachium celere]CDF58385.1 Glycerol-3-phosphate dehydrogenase [Thermobrachium celere DSM 8682]